MSFDTYFRLTSYAFVTTAFAALAATGEVDLIAISLYLAALAVSFYADTRGIERFRLREWMWRALAIAYVPFLFVDAQFLSKQRVLALVHMTLFASAAKLFQKKRDRDWVFLYLIAFFQMLLAAGLTFNPTFVGSLVVFTFFFVSTLAAFEIRRTKREVVTVDEEVITRLPKTSWLELVLARARRARLKGSSHGRASSGRNIASTWRVGYLVAASLSQLVAVFVLTLPLFFLIPRFGGGGGAKAFGGDGAFTGFSKTVRLGDVARIKENSRVVMRARLDRNPGRFIRWRGIALDRFNGRAWTSTRTGVERRQDIHVAGEGWAGNKDFVRTYMLDELPGLSESNALQRESFSGPVSPVQSASTTSSLLLRQDAIVEPLGVGTLFAANRLVKLNASFPIVFVEDTRAVSTELRRARLSYTAVSDIRIPSEEELRADSGAHYPPKISETCLQLPARQDGSLTVDPRIEKLARDITSNQPTTYDRARAIENYLKNNFGYTLNLQPTRGDPLAEFLFDVRQGHCEYFATAMTVMLRVIGIPARIVNGFQMGEYNEVSDVYTVREVDAHSWVEVYFPRSGSWVEFDPTPAAGINDYSHGGLIARFKKYLEAAEMLWMDYIVQLDSDQQASIMISLQHRLIGIKDRVVGYYLRMKLWLTEKARTLLLNRKWSQGDLPGLALILVPLIVAAFAFYMVVSHFRRRGVITTGYGAWWQRGFMLRTWGQTRWRGERVSAVLFYEQMLAILARARLIKQPHQTPAEFAGMCGLDGVREITEIYNRVRFGGAHLGEQEAHRVSALLAELKRAVKLR